MLLSSKTVRELVGRIKSIQGWDKVEEVIKRSTVDPYWIVGGTVYRTLANILHGTPIPPTIDVDVLVEGEPRPMPLDNLPYQWAHTGSSLKSHRTLARGSIKATPTFYGLQSLGIFSLPKIDLIAAKDIMEVGRKINKVKSTLLLTYFAVVPLDIQAIALDLTSECIMGRGITAVINKTIGVNNSSLPYSHTIYLRDKLLSLNGFVTTSNSAAIHLCNCDARMLFNFGCKCGGK